MAFDINSARKEGYSDDEIASFLEQNHRNFDVRGALKSGYSLDDITSELSSPKTLAEKSVSALREFSPFPTSQKEIGLPIISGNQQDLATLPARPIEALDKYGTQVKEAAIAPIERGMDATVSKLPLGTGVLPNAAAIFANEAFAKPVLRMATPFSPSEFGGLGSMAMGASFDEPRVEREIAPKLGKAYAENVVPSKPKDIRHAQKYDKQTAAELVMERPHLGNSRDDIQMNSEKLIDKLESQIQKKLDSAVKEGKVSKPVLDDEFSAMQEKYNKPIVLAETTFGPRSKEELLKTATSVGPNRGGSSQQRRVAQRKIAAVSYQEDPNLEKIRISNLKKQKADDILVAREAFKKRLSNPEYSHGIGKKYAISKEDIAGGFDNVIKDAKTAGTESKTIAALKEIKSEFLDSHPDWADVQYWNDVKRALYKLVGDPGYVAENPTGKVQAQKAMANRIKRGIERIVPDIKGLNEEQGALLNIKEAIIYSSPREVRDVSLTGPLKERAAIAGARALSKTRKSPPTPPMPVSIPVLRKLSNNNNAKDK